QERSHQAHSKQTALEQRRAAQAAAQQQERQAERQRWVQKLAKWEQQQLAKEALAKDASARSQCSARKPIRPLIFEGPFQELPLGMVDSEGLGLQEAWEAWQQQLGMQQEAQMGLVFELGGVQQPQQVLYTAQPFQLQQLLLHQAGGQPDAAGPGDPGAVLDRDHSSAGSPFKPSLPHPQAIPHPHSTDPTTSRNSDAAMALAGGSPSRPVVALESRSAPASPLTLPPVISGLRFAKPPSAGPRIASSASKAGSDPAIEAGKAAAAAVVQSGGSLAAAAQAANAAAEVHLKLPAAAGTAATAAGTAVPAAGTAVPAAGTAVPAAGTAVPAAGIAVPATITTAPTPVTGTALACTAKPGASALTPDPMPTSSPVPSPPMQQQQQQQQHLASPGCTLAPALAPATLAPTTLAPTLPAEPAAAAAAAAAALLGQSPAAATPGVPHSQVSEPAGGVTGLGLGGSERRPSPPAAGQDRGSLRTPTAPSTPLTPSFRGPRSKMSSRGGLSSPEPVGLLGTSAGIVPKLSHAHLTAAPQDWDELFGKGSEPHLPSWMRRLVARTVAAGLVSELHSG
ncbi:hypothetical protein DUNSADRAFT_6667, partial [Dunaliella salina]